MQKRRQNACSSKIRSFSLGIFRIWWFPCKNDVRTSVAPKFEAFPLGISKFVRFPCRNDVRASVAPKFEAFPLGSFEFGGSRAPLQKRGQSARRLAQEFGAFPFEIFEFVGFLCTNGVRPGVAPKLEVFPLEPPTLVVSLKTMPSAPLRWSSTICRFPLGTPGSFL